MRLLVEIIRGAGAPILIIAAGVFGLQLVPAGADRFTEALFGIIDGLSSAPQLLAIVAVEVLSRSHQKVQGKQISYADLYSKLTTPQLVLVGWQSFLKAATPLGLVVSIFFVRF